MIKNLIFLIAYIFFWKIKFFIGCGLKHTKLEMPHAGTINYCHSFALNGTCSRGNKVKFSENSFKLIKI